MSQFFGKELLVSIIIIMILFLSSFLLHIWQGAFEFILMLLPRWLGFLGVHHSHR